MKRFGLSMLAVTTTALIIGSVAPARVGCKHAFEG
jgi:hypothetical protein